MLLLTTATVQADDAARTRDIPNRTTDETRPFPNAALPGAADPAPTCTRAEGEDTSVALAVADITILLNSYTGWVRLRATLWTAIF